MSGLILTRTLNNPVIVIDDNLKLTFIKKENDQYHFEQQRGDGTIIKRVAASNTSFKMNAVVTVEVLKCFRGANTVIVKICAPRDMPVHRLEIWETIQREKACKTFR